MSVAGRDCVNGHVGMARGNGSTQDPQEGSYCQESPSPPPRVLTDAGKAEHSRGHRDILLRQIV